MQIYDISVTISPQMPVWPGDPRVGLERVGKIEEGSNANVSRLECGVHMGTHVDAPYHFLSHGTPVETLPLDVLIGKALVIEAPQGAKVLDRAAIAAVWPSASPERVLFKTSNSRHWANGETEFQTDFVAIGEDGARFLVERGVKLVGIDYLSIAPFKNSRPTHEVLLEAKMVVIEGVDLSQVAPGEYTLCCLPLKLAGSDGAPARTVLIKE